MPSPRNFSCRKGSGGPPSVAQSPGPRRGAASPRRQWAGGSTISRSFPRPRAREPDGSDAETRFEAAALCEVGIGGGGLLTPEDFLANHDAHFDWRAPDGTPSGLGLSPAGAFSGRGKHPLEVAF